MQTFSRTASRRRAALGRTVFATIGVLLSATALANAHDFWLVPNAFEVGARARIEVRGQTSSRFPTTESAVTVDRVADARLIGASAVERITDLAVSGKSLRLRHRPAVTGQHVLAVTLHPRSLRESAASFQRYLELEGAPDALARVEREGLLRGRDSVTRRYAKYAKTIVEAGKGGPRAFTRTAGHPLEFVPDQDPRAVKVGDTLRVTLLYRAHPLAGVRVHADVVDWFEPGTKAPPRRPASARGTPSVPSATTVDHVTDAEGRIGIVITRAGMWNSRTIHVVQSDAGSGADWDAHWATLVFRIAGSG